MVCFGTHVSEDSLAVWRGRDRRDLVVRTVGKRASNQGKYENATQLLGQRLSEHGGPEAPSTAKWARDLRTNSSRGFYDLPRGGGVSDEKVSSPPPGMYVRATYIEKENLCI